MSNIDLDAIEQRCNAATPICLIGIPISANNGKFLENARTDVKALLARVREQDKLKLIGCRTCCGCELEDNDSGKCSGWILGADNIKAQLDELRRLREENNRHKVALSYAANMHMYKVLGDHASYCQYNEGWQDAVDFIEDYMPAQPHDTEEMEG